MLVYGPNPFIQKTPLSLFDVAMRPLVSRTSISPDPSRIRKSGRYFRTTR